jgi:hypothetical protein
MIFRRFVVLLFVSWNYQAFSSCPVRTVPHGTSWYRIIVLLSLGREAVETWIASYYVPKRVQSCAVFWQFRRSVAHTNRWQQLQKQTSSCVGSVRWNYIVLPRKQRRGYLQWSGVFKILRRFYVHNISLSFTFGVFVWRSYTSYFIW